MGSKRRILCIFPQYARSFGTLHHAYLSCAAYERSCRPQGLLLIAATLPKEWEVRFVNENMSPATNSDFRWADPMFVSGMHVQREPPPERCPSHPVRARLRERRG